jgi:1-phosphofructokinase
VPRPRVTIFGPHPLVTVAVEDRGGADDIHVHVGGQGVCVARMAGELGADPVLCGFVGGEPGVLLAPLLEAMPGELRLVRTAATTGCYVVDRRGAERQMVATALSEAPSRHEIDELVSATCAAALESDALVIANPFPAETLPLEVYRTLVADVRQNGVPVLVDLSTPRLDSALAGAPDVVKLNDWELAEFVRAPVDSLERRLAAAQALLDAGAGSVIVTRAAEPALALRDGHAWEIAPPRFDRGAREGCGDSMMGALAAALARGDDWLDAVVTGAAAGAANFLRHGLGTGSAAVVAELRDRVEVRSLG